MITILLSCIYSPLAVAGYAAIVKNLTPFTLNIKAHAAGLLHGDEVTIAPGKTGESKTKGADLLNGVDVWASIPDKGTVKVYEKRWLGQAKKKEITIYVAADVNKQTQKVAAHGKSIGGTQTTYKLQKLTIHGAIGDLEGEGVKIQIK